MAELMDVVFAVTSKGMAASGNSMAPLAANLKTILSMVDGVCPVAQYAPFLTAFKPIDEKFQILESRGYLRRMGTVSKEAVSRFDASVSAGTRTSGLPRIDSESKHSGFLPMS